MPAARRLGAEAGRFLIGGIINTILSLAVYYVLQLYLPYQAAYAAAWVFGVAISYRVNLTYVFRARHSRVKALVFPLVYAVQYATGALLLAVLVEWLGVPKEVAPLGVVVVTIPLTFALSRYVLRLP